MQPDLLILRLQDGDEKAFERIYELYSQSLMGIIFSITRDKDVSQEILQDVFIKVWSNAKTYDPDKGRFFTWLLNIARNRAIDELRSKASRNNQQKISLDEVHHIFEASAQVDTDSIGLQRYIEILEPLCRKIIELLFFKGLTQRESAKTLDMPLGTLKTKNRNCINQIRSQING
ncbi:RNA polymerase sigma factor [Salegentibacter sp. F14]